MAQRAQFSGDLESIRKFLPSLIPDLEAGEDWYGSIYFERKSKKTILVDLKKQNLSESISAGIVLRIYDGYTLYEQATDQLDEASLKKEVAAFVRRVKNSTRSGEKQIYQPPTWEDRLARNLDPEIREQIPKNVDSQTPVHFGIRYEVDPASRDPANIIETLKDNVKRCQRIGAEFGLEEKDLNYLCSREGFSLEEAIFIDRESNLSQSLFRILLTTLALSGAERSQRHNGGLGGAECTRLTDEQIRKLMKNLVDLKKAERLKPGRYKVLCAPTITGTLAHEAFGHSQEGDTCARGRSKAWELYKSKEVVGNEHATILNNPAIFKNADRDYAAWGSYFFDEEGWFAENQVLLDKGVLTQPMTNLTSALRLGVPRSANGKRESWMRGVYTRQTNTYFSQGEETFDELMGKVDYGFFATDSAGGMEDPKGMGIQVGIAFLREIKDGKLTGRVLKGPAGGDVQMTGYTPDILKSILGKSKVEAKSSDPDRAEHPEIDSGGCGKYHKEFVFAGCGGPHVLLDGVVLG